MPLRSAPLLVAALVLAATFHYGFQVRTVAGESMVPTLPPNSIVVLERWPFLGEGTGADRLQRGDLVSVASPVSDRSYVKRIVGLPGDLVTIRGGRVYVNGEIDDLPSPILDDGDQRVQLGADEFYLLGDHRRVSFDSRSFGPVRSADMQGRVRAAFLVGEEGAARPMLGRTSTDP